MTIPFLNLADHDNPDPEKMQQYLLIMMFSMLSRIWAEVCVVVAIVRLET